MHRYVAGWATAGIATITVTVLLLGEIGSPLAGVEIRNAVIFFIATAVAGGLAVGLRTREGVHRVSFVEAAVVGCLVSLSAGWAVLVILAGLVATEVAGRRSFIKASFNVGQMITATGVAAGVIAVLRGGSDPLEARGLLAVIPAMVAFGVVNLVAIRGLMSRLRPGHPTKEDDEHDRGSAFRLSLLGNTAIGIIGALIAKHQPFLLPLLLVPLATLYLANEGVARTTALLRRSESERMRLDRIVHGVTDGVAFLDADGHVELWSPAMEQLTGVPLAGAVGVSLSDLVTVAEGDAPIDPLLPVAAATPDAPTVTVNATLSRPDGLVREVEFHHTVVFDDHEPEAIVLLLRDVTRERELERAKDDFLMRISHELRTPLTPIRGYAESLRIHQDRVTPELLNRSLERIEERAVHMTRLVDDLLLVANLGVGDTQVESTDLRLVDHVVAVWQQVTHGVSDRPLGLSVDSDHMVFADAARLQQVLAAVIDNAIRYSEAGTRVELRSQVRRGSVALDIVDEGRGIPPDHVERVFDRFHRVEDPLKMTTTGVGVGLYLARRLAESMGGTLTCRSRLGIGSTFTLTLPRGRADVREPADDVSAEAR